VSEVVGSKRNVPLRHQDGLWARAGNLLLSGWLVFSGLAWDVGKQARIDALVVGYLVFVFSVVATVIDEVRALNTLLGVWLLMSVWLLPPAHALMRWNTALVGLAMLLLSLVSSRGRLRPPSLRALLRDLEGPPGVHVH